MTELDVYELFDSIDMLTDGMFKKEYTIKKVYHGKAIDGQIEINFTDKTCVHDKSNASVCFGPPEKVYAFLIAFFRGLNFGINFASGIFTRESKSDHDSIMAQMLHKIK